MDATQSIVAAERKPITRLADRYQLLERVGQGGLATLFRARDTVLDREVALKVLHPHLRQQPAVVERLRREVAVVRQIRHPGVIRIHDLVEEADAVFLVMEYLPGGDLKGRILDLGALPADEVVRIGAAVLAALESAHRAGVVHRDVKPHNILFDAEGRVRLTDFGLARSTSLLSLTTDATVAGTPEYIAPETLETPQVDARADLYSLGATLYEAATGRLPFQARTPYETLRQQREEAPTPPRQLNAEIPEALESVLLRALEKEPGARFQTAGAFSDALQSGAPLLPLPLPPSHPCPSCGADVIDALPHCLECGRQPLVLTRAAEGAVPCEVLVVGPTKPGSQASHRVRQQCLELLIDSPLDTTRLQKKLPRYPFILASELDWPSAQQLCAALEARGIEAEAVLASDHNASSRALLRRKQWTLSLRSALVVITSTMYMNHFLLKNPVWGLLFVGALLLTYPIYALVRFRLPEALWSDHGGRGHRSALHDLAHRLTSPALLALLRRLAGKAALLDEGIARSREISAAERGAFAAAVQQGLDQGAAWLAQADAIEQELRAESEEELYGAMEKLEQRIAAAQSVDEVSTAVARRTSLGARAARIRELEQLRDRLTDRLLTLSARLDGLVLRAASLEAGALQALTQEAAALTDHLEVDDEAGRELSEFLGGDHG